MVADAWPARSRAQTFAVAASVTAHGLAFVFLIWRLGATLQPAESPVIHVELTPPWRAREPAKAEPAPSASRPMSVRPPASRRSPSIEPLIAPPQLQDSNAGPGLMLRGLFGCEHAALVSLSAEEREHCRELAEARTERLRTAAAPRLDLSQRGRFVEDATPYLARKPKNGCKVMAGGDTTPSGKEGAAVGIGCAWSF